MKYLENKFKEQNQDLEVAKKQIAAVAERVIDLERQNKTNIENGNDLVNKNKKLQKTIFDISKQSTRFRYIINWWIKPLVFMLYTILVCSFITLQFLFANAKWNLVPILLKYISTKTIIGKGEGFTLVVLDGVLFFVLRVLYKKLMKNPFNRLKRTEYRKELIEKHIENNWPQEEQFDQEWLSAMEKHA